VDEEREVMSEDREGIMTDRLDLPVLPLRETVVFPGVTAPIVAGRDKTLRAIDRALESEAEVKRIFARSLRFSGFRAACSSCWKERGGPPLCTTLRTRPGT
jgi:hypothetical protein